LFGTVLTISLHDQRRSLAVVVAVSVPNFVRYWVSINKWTIAPWSHSIHVDDLLQDYFDLDNETRDGVLDELSTSNVFPNHPTVRINVEEEEDIPQGYEIHALVETGASCAETIDYLMTEQYDQMTQTDWAKYRRKESSTINKNVNAAKNELTD